MKIQLLMVFLLFGSIKSLGQNKLTKSQLIKLFKNSIAQESKTSISIGSGEWTICDQDSAYFKADTIKLYSNGNYFHQISNCCDFVNWTFYKKNAFVQSTSQICREPASASTQTTYYSIHFFSDKGKIFFSVMGKNSVEFFQVLRIEKLKLANNDNTTEITLKRLLTNRPFAAHVY